MEGWMDERLDRWVVVERTDGPTDVMLVDLQCVGSVVSRYPLSSCLMRLIAIRLVQRGERWLNSFSIGAIEGRRCDFLQTVSPG